MVERTIQERGGRMSQNQMLEELENNIEELNADYILIQKKITNMTKLYHQEVYYERKRKNIFLNEEWLKVVNQFNDNKDKCAVIDIHGINQHIRYIENTTFTVSESIYKGKILVSEENARFIYKPDDYNNSGEGKDLARYVSVFLNELNKMYEEWAIKNRDRLLKEEEEWK